MEIPKEVIEKAIEGGLVVKDEHVTCPDLLALDREFWIALGLALGWNETGGWYTNALNFYRLILTNQSTDEFWASLLSN